MMLSQASRQRPLTFRQVVGGQQDQPPATQIQQAAPVQQTAAAQQVFQQWAKEVEKTVLSNANSIAGMEKLNTNLG